MKNSDKAMKVINDKINQVENVTAQNEKKLQEKADRIRALRQEASRLASKANKRVERLEKNGLKDSPAYKGYLASGGGRFGVRGKTHNEVQAELARLRKFIDANTSTVRGVNKYLTEIAANTGVKYKDLKDLRSKAPKFFQLAEKVEQYLRTVEDMASAIGYEKIWESINVYVEQNKIDLSDGETDIDLMVKRVSDAISEWEKPENLDFTSVGGKNIWYELPKN